MTATGHAGAMLQARQLGDELIVGVHSDESILENKGPTVMNLQERMAAVDACRWVTASVSHAPYVTQLSWITHYGCRYVVHGDDITSDSSGEDCYRFVKEAGRFKVVKRTPSISTTDLVGRMLLCTRTHFVKSLRRTLSGEDGHGSASERQAEGAVMTERMRLYATDETAKAPGASVWFWEGVGVEAKQDHDGIDEKGNFVKLFEGPGPKPGQRVVYVDGGFDLFSSGHIEFLRLVVEEEKKLAAEKGWDKPYSPVHVVAGVHDDEVINHWKGVNYPIMNIYERGLCVLQCKVSHSPANPCRDVSNKSVRQRCHLRRPFHPNKSLPNLVAMGHARRRLPRPNLVHATHLRPLHRAKGAWHLPRNWPAHFPGRQRR